MITNKKKIERGKKYHQKELKAFLKEKADLVDLASF